MRLAPLAVLSVLLVAVPARADIAIGVDVGASYWAVPTGTSFPGAAQFDAHASVRQKFGKVFSLGGRAGVMLNVTPEVHVGIPIDAQFRFKLAIVYLEVLGGVAVMIRDPDLLRAHVAAGAGLTLAGFSIGLEGGYLSPGPYGGLRIGFSI